MCCVRWDSLVRLLDCLGKRNTHISTPRIYLSTKPRADNYICRVQHLLYTCTVYKYMVCATTDCLLSAV
jgi:hypothetical protein